MTGRVTALRAPAVALALAVCCHALSSRAIVAQAPAAEADAIVGTWFTDDSASKVQIVNDGGTYSGTVVWLRAAQDGHTPLDVKNSDKSLQTRPIMGIAILSGFTYKGNGVWDKGKVYAPRRGHDYDGELTLNKDGTLGVKASSGLGSKTVTWRRA